MKKSLICGLISALILFSSVSVQAQEAEPYKEIVTKDYIRSVWIRNTINPLSYPICELNSGETITLSWDDMDVDRTKDYYYKVVHCNVDWTPSLGIKEMDYLKGFNEQRIPAYRNSTITVIPYTHYDVTIPNENTGLTKSGNYALIIYQNNDVNDIVLVKKFMVVESKMKIITQIGRATDVAKIQTHQEVDFSVEHKNVEVSNPGMEIRVAIMQNGRWDNAYYLAEPLYQRDQLMVYDFADRIVYPAAKEFRSVDIRTILTRRLRVRSIERTGAENNVWMEPDLPRKGLPYLFLKDANGKYVFENLDREGTDPDVDGDYANVNFYLKVPERKDGEFYVFGGLSNWQLKPEFRLKWDSEIQGYTTKATLKQGYYDYLYAFVKNNSLTPDLSFVEGDSFETENEYLILVYNKPFGGLYDQLVATAVFHSN